MYITLQLYDVMSCLFSLMMDEAWAKDDAKGSAR